MPPQGEFDTLEKAARILGPIAGLLAIGAGLIRWFRKHKRDRDAARADRLLVAVRAGFAKELTDFSGACDTATRLEQRVDANTAAIENIRTSIFTHLEEGDRSFGLFLRVLKEIHAWQVEEHEQLNDLQTFLEHAPIGPGGRTIDRRKPENIDRRARSSDLLEDVEERRHERRRSVDKEVNKLRQDEENRRMRGDET